MGGFGVRARINATLRDLRLFTAAEAQYNKHPSAPPSPRYPAAGGGKKKCPLKYANDWRQGRKYVPDKK